MFASDTTRVDFKVDLVSSQISTLINHHRSFNIISEAATAPTMASFL
jgi:hypothetical protein